MPLEPGARPGPHITVAALTCAGSGEVHRARDERARVGVAVMAALPGCGS